VALRGSVVTLQSGHERDCFIEGGRGGGRQWKRRWCGGQAQKMGNKRKSKDPESDADRVATPGVGVVREPLSAHGIHSSFGLTEKLGGMDKQRNHPPSTDRCRLGGWQ